MNPDSSNDPATHNGQSAAGCDVPGCRQPAINQLTTADGDTEHLCDQHVDAFYVDAGDGDLCDRLLADSRHRVCETGGCHRAATELLSDDHGQVHHRCADCVALLERYTAETPADRPQQPPTPSTPPPPQSTQPTRRQDRAEPTNSHTRRQKPGRQPMPARHQRHRKDTILAVTAMLALTGLTIDVIAATGTISLPAGVTAIAVFGIGFTLAARHCASTATTAMVTITAVVCAAAGPLLLTGSPLPPWPTRLAHLTAGLLAGLAVLAVDNHLHHRGDATRKGGK